MTGRIARQIRLGLDDTARRRPSSLSRTRTHPSSALANAWVSTGKFAARRARDEIQAARFSATSARALCVRSSVVAAASSKASKRVERAAQPHVRQHERVRRRSWRQATSSTKLRRRPGRSGRERHPARAARARPRQRRIARGRSVAARRASIRNGTRRSCAPRPLEARVGDAAGRGRPAAYRSLPPPPRRLVFASHHPYPNFICEHMFAVKRFGRLMRLA